jgi:hypothetical protein
MDESRYGPVCRRPMRRVWVGNKTGDLRSKIIVRKGCNMKNLLILHKCTLKKETKRKRGHLDRKMPEGKKESTNDAHEGRVTKKGLIRRGEEQKG